MTPTALIDWNDSLSVNVAEIDAQHQTLAGMIAYAGTHFRTEETFFDGYCYPDTAAHTRDHAAFISQVKEFKTAFDSGKVGVSIEVMDFLSNWLRNHIKGSDKKYGPFLNKKELR